MAKHIRRYKRKKNIRNMTKGEISKELRRLRRRLGKA